MPKNLSQIAKQKKIKYFLISFVDLFGVLRSKLVPAQAISEMQKNGAGFAGFAAWLDMTPPDSDMFGIPDPNSLIHSPWKKEIGRVASNLVHG
jgi:Glutamine synthetase